MTFVFNTNLNLFYLSKERKYFEKIIYSFLKVLCSQRNEFDRKLLIDNCLAIKECRPALSKPLKHLTKQTIFKQFIKSEESEVDFNKVKNEICDMTIRILQENFNSEFTYQSTY